MNALDKAFIKAYRQQTMASGKMMPLAEALELSRENTSGSAAEEKANAEPPAAERGVASDENSPPSMPDFQPLLQVDAFVWPKVCNRLDAAAHDQLGSVAHGVDIQAKKGGKMIGFISDQAGSGCTTLLLSVARRMAQRCRVALVDANYNNPCMARNLGLLPDVGLKDVTAGRVPVAEALIESLQDRLALLPYAGHAETEYAADANTSCKDLRQLANNYDLVLIDLGTGDNSTLSQIDASVIVQDARGRRSSGSCRAKEILQAAGVGIVGIVENRTISEEADDFYGAA